MRFFQSFWGGLRSIPLAAAHPANAEDHNALVITDRIFHPRILLQGSQSCAKPPLMPDAACDTSGSEMPFALVGMDVRSGSVV